MSRNKLIPGADYVPRYTKAARTRLQWQELIASILAAGGRRRVENGETFVHDAQGLVVHEIYTNIPMPNGKMQMLAGLAAGILTLSGCAVAPNNVHVGAEHLSSISQHFGPDATNVAVEMATLSALWQPTRNTYLEIQDGYIVSGATFVHKREIFEARAGLNFPVKP